MTFSRTLTLIPSFVKLLFFFFLIQFCSALCFWNSLFLFKRLEEVVLILRSASYSSKTLNYFCAYFLYKRLFQGDLWCIGKTNWPGSNLISLHFSLMILKKVYLLIFWKNEFRFVCDKTTSRSRSRASFHIFSNKFRSIKANWAECEYTTGQMSG